MKPDNKSARLTRLVICRAGTAALGLLLGLLPSLTMAQETTLVISVRDHDFNRPVYSEIWQLTHESTAPLNETDEQGQLELTMVCTQGTAVQARPFSDAYRYSQKVYCQGKKKIEFSVTSIPTVLVLQENLSAAAAAGDFKTAAHLATELSWVEPRSSKDLRRRRC